jgi:hypothetical protein
MFTTASLAAPGALAHLYPGPWILGAAPFIGMVLLLALNALIEIEMAAVRLFERRKARTRPLQAPV